MHATSKDDSKDCFYEEIEEVLDLFPNYHMKILLRDFIVNWGERTFSNRQMRMRIYLRAVVVLVLEQ